MLGQWITSLFRAFFSAGQASVVPLDTRQLAEYIVAWIETPIGKQWIEDAKLNEDHDFLHEIELARLQVAQLNHDRISRAVPPFLPGSPAEWLWQVDQSAEMAVIISGLEEALTGSVYDAPEGRSRSIPRPLTGSMMRDKFHQLYHVYREPLIWTIDHTRRESSWTLTPCSSLCPSSASSTVTTPSLNTAVDLPLMEEQGAIPCISIREKPAIMVAASSPLRFAGVTPPLEREPKIPPLPAPSPRRPMVNIRNNKTLPVTNTRIPRLNTISRGRTTSSMENISVRVTSDTTSKTKLRTSRPAPPPTTNLPPKFKAKPRRESPTTSRPTTPVTHPIPTHRAIPHCPSIAFNTTDVRMSASLGGARNMVAPTALNLPRFLAPLNVPSTTHTTATNALNAIPKPTRLAPKRSFRRPDP